VPQGRIVPDEELKEMGAFFPDRYFGELIFLVEEGVLIVPSHMGERPLRAMHGYHPTAPQSYAALMTNQGDMPEDITAIPDVYRLMTAEAQESHRVNSELAHKELVSRGASSELITLQTSTTNQNQEGKRQ
jgi:hypothetical protein